MNVEIKLEDFEIWIGQLYIQNRQLEKAVMMLDMEKKKGIITGTIIPKEKKKK